MKKINSILLVTTILILIFIFLISRWFHFPTQQIIGIIIFLGLLLGFFTAILELIYKRSPKKYLIAYFILIIIKFCFILIFLFIAKEILQIVNKKFLSFFLMAYFSLFLIQILYISTKLKNLKTDK